MKKYIVKETNENVVNEPALVYGSFEPSLLSMHELARQARAGISMAYLNQLISKLAINLQEIGNILNVSMRTLQRYDASKTLDIDLSSKVLKLAELQAHGLEVFGTEAAFNSWLRKPVPTLGGQKPLEMLDTPFGMQMVDDVLGRIEHGIFA